MRGIYAIADAATLARWGVELREFAEALRAVGTERVGTVQWRCKGRSAGEVLAGAAVLRDVLAETGCRLIMNDSAELAVRAGFDGVHLGQGDGGVEEARRVMGGSRLVGISTHTEEQVRLAAASSADYVAIGPVFATTTKLDAEPVVGPGGVRAARLLTSKTLVAIGGITPANAREVFEAGADLVAVIGGLRQPGRGVEESVRGLLRAIDEQT